MIKSTILSLSDWTASMSASKDTVLLLESLLRMFLTRYSFLFLEFLCRNSKITYHSSESASGKDFKTKTHNLKHVHTFTSFKL